jgi:predicted ATPase
VVAWYRRPVTGIVQDLYVMFVRSVTIRRDQFPTHEAYPFAIRAFQHTDVVDLSRRVTVFVGDNGSGKSTLLTALARRCNIHIWQGLTRSRYRRSRWEERFHEFIELSLYDGAVAGAFFASEMFRNFSQLVDEWASSDPGLLEYFGGRSLMQLSHGQSHMAFFRNRFMRPGLYLLDEPENALSPASQLALMQIIDASASAGNGQFVIATHSPFLLSIPAAAVLSFDHAPIREVAYRRTEHFRVYSRFFAPDQHDTEKETPDV